ncbi:MAG: Hint domain-containing protein [Limisphaerales bacterium]
MSPIQKRGPTGLPGDRGAQLLFLLVFLLTPALGGCSMIGPLVGAAMPFAGAKMMFACIPEGTGVDTPAGPRPIQHLEAGDTVTGFGGEPVRILQKHSYLENPETEFLRIELEDGAAVELCGMHRVDGIRAGDVRLGQRIAGRHVTGIHSRRGVVRSFDLLTEDAGYRIQGVPVNSMIEELHQALRGRSPARGQ